MNDKITKVQFNIWANDESEGEEVAKVIGHVVDWYGQRGLKVTASHLKEALAKWESTAIIRQGIMNYLK